MRIDLHEALVVEDLGGQERGVRTGGAHSPQDDVGGERRLAGGPLDGIGGEFVAGESSRQCRPVFGMHDHAVGLESSHDPTADRGMESGQRLVAAVEQMHRGAAAPRQVVGHTDAGGAATDHGDGGSRGETVVHGAERGVDGGEILDPIMTPEAVAHPGGDHECGVLDTSHLTRRGLDLDRCVRQIGADDPPVHDIDRVEATKAPIRDEIGAAPTGKVGQARAEFLTAHEGGAGRDSDHATRTGESCGDEHSGVAQSGHQHRRLLSCHVRPLSWAAGPPGG